MTEQPRSRPRDRNTWTVCEEHGIRADAGRCVIHGGDACLIRVGWISQDSAQARLEQARVLLQAARNTLRYMQRCARTQYDYRAVEDVIRQIDRFAHQERRQ